ncbi:phage tail protein [Pararhizobium haloflavum]|uniref:phage tail protein n=1 Tax=Pararhizobium haloflavum TaxID=2037914 RepID=UPI000C18F8CA|nr:phage tail protein [Pararhizobium haloflavum]
MLFQIGTVTVDTRPFNIEEVERTGAADYAVKPVIGSLPSREFMGEGDDRIVISGQLLPQKVGGLTELEALHAFRRGGETLPVMRGDGKMFGWFVVEEIREEHSGLFRDGVGSALKHSVTLAKSAPEQASASIVGALVSLFNVIGR